MSRDNKIAIAAILLGAITLVALYLAWSPDTAESATERADPYRAAREAREAKTEKDAQAKAAQEEARAAEQRHAARRQRVEALLDQAKRVSEDIPRAMSRDRIDALWKEYAAIHVRITEAGGPEFADRADDLRRTTASRWLKRRKRVTPNHSAAQVADAYHRNQVRADSQLKGRRFIVEGKIERIEKTSSGEPYVEFEDDKRSGWKTVRCMFTKRDQADLAPLEKGQRVSIEGTCAGMSYGNIHMLACELLDKSDT